jgi:hypothetical protein
MPPKKNISKTKPKPKPKAKPKPKVSKKKETSKSIPLAVFPTKISNKPQTQNVNVNVSVGGKTSESSKSKDKEPREMKSSNASKQYSQAPTIIPQYIAGNPPPMPPQPPSRVVQSVYTPIKPNTNMTSPASLDSISSLSTPTMLSGTNNAIRGISLDNMSDLSDFISRQVRNQPNYIVSGLTSELEEESYKYSEPSGINLKSVNSTESDMMMPIPKTNFTNRPYDTTQLDSFDEMAQLVRASISQSLQEKIARQRPPLKEIIYDDGSIQVLTEEQEPLTLEMSKSDQPALSGIPDEEFEQLSIAERVKLMDQEIKKRGRKPGQKNRSKEEIEAEKAEKEKKKAIKEAKKMREELIKQRRSEFFANRQDEIDREIEEGNRFDIVEQRVTERKKSQQKMKEI